ncbi:MAG: helix-turn-helix domain-containing protein [Enterococcus avium]
MTYKLFLSLYSEALSYADTDMFIGERGWQDWMDDYPTEELGTLMQDIFFLAKSDLKTIREKYGYSRAAFSRSFDIPVRSLEDWDAGRRKMPDYVKVLICYALFESKQYEV